MMFLIHIKLDANCNSKLRFSFEILYTVWLVESKLLFSEPNEEDARFSV